jgi:hypothetical protein
LLGGVAFPLMVTAGEITVLSYSLDDIFAAPTVVVGELTSGEGRDVPIDQLAREGFNVPYVHAVVVRPDQTVDELLDGLINWRRLSGQWPERSRSMQLTVPEAARRALVMPTDVFLELVAQLRALRADVLAGRRQAKLDDTPVPPLRPLTPELEEYERLLTVSMADAWEYGKELYARGG